ncbi:MAG: T9SS type A sorting domain-containing protein [Chitinophagales bacterium]|nr:T9SS type A sorting domain-containing protein [Chitinophagales bacterium]
MKKVLLTIFVCVVVCTMTALACIVNGGSPTPIAPATEACPNSDPNDLIVTQYSTTGTLNTTKIVVSKQGVDFTGATIDLIVGLSDNGAFDFVGSDGNVLNYAEYQFHAFSYDQTALNALATQINPLWAMGEPIPVDSNGNVHLGYIFSILNELFPGLTLQDVEYAFCTFAPGLGINFDYGLSNPYTIVWKATGCIIGMDNVDKNAFAANINVTNNTATVLLNTNKTTQIAVYNVNGTLVEQFTANTSTFSFPIDQYSNGLYLVRTTSGNQTVATKFVK